jgi:methylglutaconyl-CoA hydratase
MTELVHSSTDAGVTTLTLDSPHNRNALSADSMEQLRAGLDAALADDTVRVVVLSHAGRVFCSGMDLRTRDVPVSAFPSLLTAISTAPKPVVARVGGAARAGGIGLLAAADIAVAGASANFAFTEVRIGVVPAVISVPVLPRMLPRAAHELFLTGEVFDAARAAAVGLVNVAVPDVALDLEVERYAALLVQGAPGALAATKDLLAAPSSDYAAMAALSASRFASDEGREGIAAFTARRRPSWVPESAR